MSSKELTVEDVEHVELLISAQNGDLDSEEQLIQVIQKNYMNRRIAKFLHKNRQVEDEDLKQEFLIGVALNINRARLDIGDPIEYLIQQGLYRVRSYLRKHIIQNTSQVCGECGYITRLNRVGTEYICKRCGSNNNMTQEINDHNEILLQSMVDQRTLVEDEVMSDIIIKQFEDTLTPNTNMHNLYIILTEQGINRDNPNIKNYIKEISKMWGGCSDQNIIQNMNKLKKKVLQFAEDNDLTIDNGCFVYIDDLERGL